ncbi:hypothetical protein AL036_19260 [Salipiger aestuarii]|uniref:Glycosyl transferase family 1 n=1 Tax=Salipiger aestuarii TaxID=568098 RepID=A0A327XV56_9RHOB|nr:glycosyltransferase family 1 protein [Salipiger aestuarii]EIE51122.1 alpha-glycosyltransferase protein [Citreicella sp. 357]KAA8605393.1 hypothetical protein AL036_19260 [Salipiger aestuarii]KAB2538822.1 hypothetical protein AL035_18825 [Salipiger aestuarii]RAK09879.1 glycosyl transferase family 1 [Salipiger aestuarii]
MRRIAIPFELDENWVGGSYYIRNLISAMSLLPLEEQPFILLVSEKPESVRFIQESGYPNLGWATYAEFGQMAAEGLADVVFPYPIAGQEARTISWIPDFQELHLGYFFADDEIARRRDHHRRRFATAGLIVSSEDVRKDVDTFYPGECENVAVVRFASFDCYDPDRVDAVRRQYALPERYVFCANQVWLHKNHILVIRAVALLKEMGIAVTMVFTGNEADYRVAGYADFLKRQAAEWGIADQVRFLGFIPRGDQLCLMKAASYIVQPSLFEGWSTVIEDAKSMGKFIVASDLGVHKEQLTEACRFFFRHDPQALAETMAQIEEHLDLHPLPERGADYTEARRSFARDLMAAVDRFVPQGADAETALAQMRKISGARLASLPEDLPAAPALTPKAPARAPVATPQMPQMPRGRLTGIRISVEERSDDFRALMMFCSQSVRMSRPYDKFMVKVLQIRGNYQIELRSGSISPPLVTADNSDGSDSYGYFLRIALTPCKDSALMIGRVAGLGEEVIEDINCVIEAGIARLQDDLRTQHVKASEFVTSVAAGVRLAQKP